MEIAVIIVLGLAVVAFIAWQVVAGRKFAALPPEVQAGINRAKESRTQYRQLAKAYPGRVKTAADRLANLEDQKGRKVKSAGRVTLHERWIDTPQGGGPLLGVKAEAADESSIRQRLTATRMLAFGIFALAAPKKKGTGNAYVVIEGPDVSGVATLPAKDDKNAGATAFSFAAAINNAARTEERAKLSRPEAIEGARAALAQAENKNDILAAGSIYAQAVAALPREHRLEFTDVPAQPWLPRESGEPDK